MPKWEHLNDSPENDVRRLNPLELKPWRLTELDPEYRETQTRALLDFRARTNRPEPTPEEMERHELTWRERQADRQWLRDNVPVGTTFSYIGGAEVMVLGHVWAPLTDASHDFKSWQADLHIVVGGTLTRERVRITTLRAMVEPGFVVTHGARPSEMHGEKSNG